MTVARVGSGQLPTRCHAPRTDRVLAVEWLLGRGPRCPDPPVPQGAVGLALGTERGHGGAWHSHPGGPEGVWFLQTLPPRLPTDMGAPEAEEAGAAGGRGGLGARAPHT